MPPPDLGIELLRQGLRLGEGVRPDGSPVGWTLDLRAPLLRPSVLRRATAILWDAAASWRPRRIGGMELSAVPLVSAMLLRAEDSAPSATVDGFVVRRRAKTYGLRRQVEGSPPEAGDRVVLVDDLLNSGETLGTAIAVTELCGATVVGVVVLVDFERRGHRDLVQRGIPVRAGWTASELGLMPSPIASRRPRASQPLRPRWTSPPGTPSVAPTGRTAIAASATAMVRIDRFGGRVWETAWPGIRATTKIGPVVIVASDRSLAGLSAITGVLLWQRDLDHRIVGGPVATDRDAVIVLDDVGVSIVAVDPESGRERWCTPRPPVVAVDCRPATSGDEIALAQGSLLTVIDGLDPDRGWQLQLPAPISGVVGTQPGDRCRRGDPCWVVTSTDGMAYGIDAARRSWARRIGRHAQLPMILGDQLLVVGSSHLVALQLNDGTLRWVRPLPGRGCRLHAGPAESAVLSWGGRSQLIDARGRSAGALPPGLEPTAVSGELLITKATDGSLSAFTLSAVEDGTSRSRCASGSW